MAAASPKIDHESSITTDQPKYRLALVLATEQAIEANLSELAKQKSTLLTNKAANEARIKDLQNDNAAIDIKITHIEASVKAFSLAQIILEKLTALYRHFVINPPDYPKKRNVSSRGEADEDVSSLENDPKRQKHMSSQSRQPVTHSQQALITQEPDIQFSASATACDDALHRQTQPVKNKMKAKTSLEISIAPIRDRLASEVSKLMGTSNGRIFTREVAAVRRCLSTIAWHSPQLTLPHNLLYHLALQIHQHFTLFAPSCPIPQESPANAPLFRPVSHSLLQLHAIPKTPPKYIV